MDSKTVGFKMGDYILEHSHNTKYPGRMKLIKILNINDKYIEFDDEYGCERFAYDARIEVINPMGTHYCIGEIITDTTIDSSCDSLANHMASPLYKVLTKDVE